MMLRLNFHHAPRIWTCFVERAMRLGMPFFSSHGFLQAKDSLVYEPCANLRPCGFFTAVPEYQSCEIALVPESCSSAPQSSSQIVLVRQCVAAAGATPLVI